MKHEANNDVEPNIAEYNAEKHVKERSEAWGVVFRNLRKGTKLSAPGVVRLLKARHSIKIHRDTILKFERGENGISLRMMVLLLNIYGATVSFTPKSLNVDPRFNIDS